jgi:hypothetical protein
MAISRVQFKSNTGVGVTSLVITPDVSPSTGNFQALTIAYGSSTSNRVTSITQTNTIWSRAVQKNNTLGRNISVDIWYSESAKNPGTTITINLASSVDVAATYLEYSGVATFSSLDKTATNEDYVGGK